MVVSGFHVPGRFYSHEPSICKLPNINWVTWCLSEDIEFVVILSAELDSMVVTEMCNEDEI